MPSALFVVAGLLVVLGGALAAKGAVDLRRGPSSRAITARVASHAPVTKEMITGARGAKRDVALVEIALSVDDDPSRAHTILRAPELAARDFVVGSTHTIHVDDAGRAHTQAPTSTLAVVELAGGLLLAFVGLALFAIARRSA